MDRKELLIDLMGVVVEGTEEAWEQLFEKYRYNNDDEPMSERQLKHLKKLFDKEKMRN